MSETIRIPFLRVSIRRDASTVVEQLIPAHELAILERVFGAELVSAEPADTGHTAAVTSTASEAERLGSKYSPQVVEEVFGHAAHRLSAALHEASEPGSTQAAAPARRAGRPPKAQVEAAAAVEADQSTTQSAA